MEMDLGKIVVIVGGYGSGKTEVSINLAVNWKRGGLDVCIADLDLVNPYFRTREARGALSEMGIEVILPPEEYLRADLPVLSPAIAGMIGQRGRMTLVDAGGDRVGVTVLAALADSLRGQNVRMLQVVNPFRPFADTVGGCLKTRDEIENASRMRVSGFIGNANLLDDTAAEDIYRGYDFVKMLSRESGVPLECIAVAVEMLARIDMKRFSCPVLMIERQLVPPWTRPVRFQAKNLGRRC